MVYTRTIGVVIAILAALSSAYGQDAPVPPPDPVRTTSVQGSFDVGYRWRSLKGSEQSFRQLFDLSEGTRLFGLDLHGSMGQGAATFADAFAVTLSGLGDPFPTLQASLTKSRRYNLRVNWRRSHFFDFAPETPLSVGGFDTRVVTDRHTWTTARQVGGVAWTVDATNRLHFLLNYDRVSNAGSIQTTRSLDYTGASSVWAAFARANAYELFGPTDNTANRVAAGVSYVRDRWTLNYRLGYQILEDRQTFEPSAAPERSINVVDAVTASEPLATLAWKQSRRLNAPTTDVSFVARPTPAVEWRSQYLFQRYRGPFDLNAEYQGTARSNSGGTIFSPYRVAVGAHGTASTPSHILDQEVTWMATDRMAFDAGYRYSRSTSAADALLESTTVLSPTGTAAATIISEDVATGWRNTIHSLDLTATWSPVPALTVRPGVRLVQRDVEMRNDGIVEPGATERERAIWPEIAIGYRPHPEFSARASYQTAYSDASYTRISPIQRSTGRVSLRLEPAPGLSVEASATQADAELPEAAFVSHTRTGSLTLGYAVNDRFSVTGGLDYQSFLGTGNGTFLRGVLPIDDLPLHDREIDRVWQLGFNVKPAPGVGIVASANFDRTTGLDSIFGEPSLYGPVSFPYATATVYYEIARAGRISVDLQRAYLTQDILSLNNFRASLLTLRFSRAF